MHIQAEANLAALIESTEDLIWSVGPGYRLLTFNRALREHIERNFGGPVAAGMRLEELLPPARAALWPSLFDRALAGERFRSEFSLSDGRILDLSFNPIVIDGEIAGASVFGKDITERKKAESAFREAEKKYRDILDGALEGMFQTSVEGRSLTANPAMAKMLGYDSPEELVSCASDVAQQVWADPNDRAGYLRQLEVTGAVMGLECRFKRKDGTILWVSLSSRRVCEADGRVLYLEGFVQDITERKRAEESSRLFTAIVESSEDAIIAYTPAGAILSWNRGAEAIYGYSAEEAIGKPVSIMVPPERRAAVDRHTELLLQGHADLHQGLGIRKDGRRIHISVTSWPMRNSAGAVTAICAIIRDVTALHEAEEARALLASIVESSDDAVHAVNLDGTVTSWNRGSERLFGYTSEEMLGKNVAILALPEREEEVRRNFRIVQEGSTVGPFDALLPRKDGSRVEVSLTISPIRDSAGEVVGAAAIARDITQRKQAERALSESEARFHGIFVENGSVMLLIEPESGEIVDANPAASSYYGYAREQLVGMSLSKINTLPPEEMAANRRMALRGERSQFSFRHRLASGKERDVEVYSSPVEVGGRPLLYSIVHDTTDREKAEGALRESLDALQQAQVIGALGDYALDIPSGEWTSSFMIEEIFGIGKEYPHTVAGWLGLIHPGDRAMMSDYLADDVLGKGNAFDKEYRIIRPKDGAERWVHGRGKLEFDADGQALKMRGIIQDITDRKLSEMQLRDSEERYRSTFEQAAVGIVHASFEGRVLRCNARFAELVGYPLKEITGLTVRQMTAPEDMPETGRALERILGGAASTESLEKRYIRKDGSLTWAKVTISIQRDGGGRPLHFIALAEDIHARKAAEERLAAAAEALRQSEEHYRTVFHTSPDAVMIARQSDGVILDVNQSFLDSARFERNEVIGHKTAELGIWVNESDLQMFIDQLNRHGRCRDLEVLSRRKDGEIFWMSLSASTIEIGGEHCRITFAKEISEIKAAEERTAAAQEALRQSEERYRTVFQTSLDCITISHLSDGSYIDVNKAFLDLIGIEPEEIAGQTSTGLGIWAHPETRAEIVEMLRRDSSLQDYQTQLVRRNGELIWVLISASVIEIEGVPCIVSFVRDISSAKAAESTIRSLAFYDPLTGLPNRRQLFDRLSQTLAACTPGGRLKALLLLDLDNLKTLNDTLGHHRGDLLLQEAARRIAACGREADTVGRLGGDEFVVILGDLSEVAGQAATQAKTVGEEILASIGQPCLLEHHEWLPAASMGITIFGNEPNQANDVLQQADIALQMAKADGRNTMRFFSTALQAVVNARARLEEELRLAVRTGQFLLYYQPQINRGRMTGVEALIRWKHPRRGTVPPDEFIPLAEESRLILPLGEWVLEAACRQIASWAGREEAAHLSIAVNISALQFRQPEFVEQVLAALDRTGANPKNLKLELTESMLVDNVDEVISKMTELKSHGLSFALDDFGTGYSSLAYLKRLPLDQLKIDRAFVRDMLVDLTSGAIAQTIISLGRAMDLSVMAEGVETEEQRGFLAGLGCHSFQGYLFSRPLPLEEFEALLEGIG